MGDVVRARLTPRQCDILSALARGRAQKEIAFSLGISERAVRFHIQRAIERLDSRTCTEAVVRALQERHIVLDGDGRGESDRAHEPLTPTVPAVDA